MESRIRTCPGCGLSISAYTSGVLYPHLDLRGQPCQGCDDAADTDDQWILILREELGYDFAVIGDIYGLTPDGACKRYHGARRRENARVERRGWA
ncbi:hypothetical protein [Saccharopolyspora sp. NPDC049357]|uniref:hypothetical protein n=1 Tax=Saccharopolyspora sp. NPDC049357 TaxID=3154507 RepID=UPI003439E943